jgi:hypothetical protein
MTPEREAAIREAAGLVHELEEWCRLFEQCNRSENPDVALRDAQDHAVKRARLGEALRLMWRLQGPEPDVAVIASAPPADGELPE